MTVRHWTEADKDAFIKAWNAGEPVESIAARMRCERTTITFWRKRFGLEARPRNVKRGEYSAKRGRSPRVCLNCDRTFQSYGIWNRVCPTCRDNVEFRQGADLASVSVGIDRRGNL